MEIAAITDQPLKDEIHFEISNPSCL